MARSNCRPLQYNKAFASIFCGMFVKNKDPFIGKHHNVVLEMVLCTDKIFVIMYLHPAVCISAETKLLQIFAHGGFFVLTRKLKVYNWHAGLAILLMS